MFGSGSFSMAVFEPEVNSCSFPFAIRSILAPQIGAMLEIESMNVPRNIIFGLLLLLQVIFIVLIEIQIFSSMDFGSSPNASGLLDTIGPDQWGNIAFFLCLPR
jgi:hypothetical protein